jgi:hypothetical protein
MRPLQERAIDAQAATYKSSAIDAKLLFQMSVFVIAAGTIAGTVKLQVSNLKATPAVDADWIDLPSATITMTGTAGNFLIPKTEICYQWVRVVSTVSGGTGTATADVKALGQ